MSGQNLKARMESLINALTEGLHERREHVAVALLAVLAGQNVFLLGPPGTAKSMLARRLKSAFAGLKDHEYFEYLMHRFSTPEEVFGPISITELKQDNYVRKPRGFLPEAKFAFLDEIWKSTSAILNTLLTIINEKIFRNGTKLEKVPLIGLIAASNETPVEGRENEGLEALYDRFLVRLYVPPMKPENLEKLLQGESAPEIACGDAAVKPEELKEWREKIKKVKLSAETLAIIRAIRLRLSEGLRLSEDKELKNVYVSDRRWQQAAMLLKAAAFFCGRKETNMSDDLLLRYCLWTTEENREAVVKIVEDAAAERGFVTEQSSDAVILEKDKREQQVKHDLLHRDDVYETESIHGNEYIVRTRQYRDGKDVEFCIPLNKMKTKGDFHPVDRSGNEISDLVCNAHGQGNFTVRTENRGYYSGFTVRGERKEKILVNPRILFRRGDRKGGINPEIPDMHEQKVRGISGKLDKIIQEIEMEKSIYEGEIDSPFIMPKIREVAMRGVENQLEQIRVAREACDLLQNLIKG